MGKTREKSSRSGWAYRPPADEPAPVVTKTALGEAADRARAAAAGKAAAATAGASGTVREYEPLIVPMLASYGHPDPRTWGPGDFRRLVAQLDEQGDWHDARAVERYAEARLVLRNAAKAVERAGHAVACPRAGTKVPKPPKPVRKGISTEYRPVARSPLPSPEPWHATVPPWEDRPAC